MINDDPTTHLTALLEQREILYSEIKTKIEQLYAVDKLISELYGRETERA